MSDLAQKKCIPCRGGVPPLQGQALADLLRQLGHGWSVVDARRLTKTYAFADFATGLAFVNRIGAIADAEAHHPDVYLAWGKVRIEVWTHTINGLTESDFVLAAKIEQAQAR